MPSVLLKSGDSHCVDFEAAQDTVLRIDYEAPDIPLDQNDPDYTPSFISVSMTASSNRIMDTQHHEAPVRQHLKPTKVLLRDVKGTVEHKMELHGTATLCLLAPHMHERNKRYAGRSYRLGFRVLAAEEILNAAAASGDKPDVDLHLSHMEKEMERIEQSMKSMIKEANFAKDRDTAMHKQFLEMHSTTMYWPIVQVCVLLITGFTQASHIVRFFQSRRII
jgi:hypothetical protein